MEVTVGGSDYSMNYREWSLVCAWRLSRHHHRRKVALCSPCLRNSSYAMSLRRKKPRCQCEVLEVGKAMLDWLQGGHEAAKLVIDRNFPFLFIRLFLPFFWI